MIPLGGGQALDRGSLPRLSEVERWKRLGELLAEASEHPTAERAAFLEQACPDPELRREAALWVDLHGRASGFLEDSAGAWLEPEGAGAFPTRVGSYQVLAELGQGGMGTVYLALEGRLGSAVPVALKVLRSSLTGAHWRRRFETERQALLSLRHPYIARLLDAGETAEGTPYLVLEYVAGARLLDHCRERGLDLRARLSLFCQVCEAVQHAHQNLVLHRDLKPANVLVDAQGDPKLLDFGLAKLLRSDEGDTVTAAEMRPLTPGYASPEQLRGEAMTTASDVFALGVVLHELLTGARPFAGSEGQVESLQRAIAAGAAPLPGTLGAERDLDAVVRKALRFDPAERYATAFELREDLLRHLAGRPVRARAASGMSLIARFVRRHRVAVFLTAALVAVAAATAVSAWRQHLRLVQAQARAERVTELLVDVFAAPDPENAQGKSLSAIDLLDRGERRLRERLAGEPQVRAALLHTLGEVYEGLGSYERAADMLTEALVARRGIPDNEREVGESLAQLAEVRFSQGDYAASVRLATEGRSLLERSGFGHSRLAIINLRTLGVASLQRGELDRGEEMVRRALTLQREQARAPEVDTIRLLNDLSLVCGFRGRDGEALALAEEAMALAHRLGDPADPEVNNAFATLALALSARDEVPERALVLQRSSIERSRALFGEHHPFALMDRANLALMLSRAGQWKETERLASEVLAVEDEVLGREHPSSVVPLTALGRARAALGDLAGAEAPLRRALEIGRRAQPDGPGPTMACLDLGHVLLARQRFSEAGVVIDDCLARCRTRYGADNWRVAQAEIVRGEWLEAAGRRAEASTEVVRAQATLMRELGPGHAHTRAAAALLKRLASGRTAAQAWDTSVP